MRDLDTFIEKKTSRKKEKFKNQIKHRKLENVKQNKIR